MSISTIGDPRENGTLMMAGEGGERILQVASRLIRPTVETSRFLSRAVPREQDTERPGRVVDPVANFPRCFQPNRFSPCHPTHSPHLD